MPAPETLNIQQPGEVAQAGSETTTQPATTPRFIVKHKGGGRYAVFDTANDGVQAGDFLGTEEQAIVEAKRLEEGGAPFIKPDEDDQANQQPQASSEAPAPATTKAIDPTTLKQPVLTADGWVCPAPKVEG